jgi:hypothetical protein
MEIEMKELKYPDKYYKKEIKKEIKKYETKYKKKSYLIHPMENQPWIFI